jgi:predicted phosphodiesterase
MCETACRNSRLRVSPKKIDIEVRNVITRSLLTAAALFALACSPTPGTLSRVEHPSPAANTRSAAQGARAAEAPASVLPNAKGSVKFLVIGDSGTGDSAQYQLAERMVQAHQRFTFEFALMLGDNLYGSEDPSDYVEKFERPYKPLLDADVKFYASLGNHDEPSQRFYEPFNMDGKRYYKFTKGDVDFFALDSTYMAPPQVEWLKKELEGSKAKWKIAYEHHPLYSSGERHGSEVDLRALIEPLFIRHGVDVVFAGHEHFYERLKPQKGIHYITQGAAAKLRRGNIRDNSAMTARGFDTDRSFTLVEIDGDQMYFETISRAGAVVDSGVIPRRETATTARR